ncbi:threonylcarbamoyl-AMP synthase [Anopheles nili]|uniref:threonylcarbamoyl-AMP synthase n=1 Tax=Anopheles nili TaxID=185578 RepID=UPI00237BA381|nr:threonylcarbamoyl-AMP synthase [Anopheles nili]
MYDKVKRIDNDLAVREAAELLANGEVIAIPTDTVYGLACRADNAEAINRLYQIKGRHESKPIAICVANFTSLRTWGQADHLSDALLHKLLPGAVTIVVKKSSKFKNSKLNPASANIGIRIPKYKFIQDVCSILQLPIALTSANVSADKSTLNIHEFQALWCKLGAVFDGGQLGLSENQRAASTVIDLTEKDRYSIIREGVAVERTIKIVEKYYFSSKEK